MDKFSLIGKALAVSQQDVPKEVRPLPPQTNIGVSEVLANIIIYILGFSAALAVLFIILGGLRYIVSAGNQDSADAAKRMVLFALLGLLIIILSFVIVNFVTTGLAPVLTP